MGRRSAGLVTVAAAAAIVLASFPSGASTSAEQSFVSRLNAERTSRGLRALSVRSDLTSVARRWAATMADAGRIWHNSNLANEVDNWRALGENVGRGPSVSSIHGAFMGSSTHRSIILDPDFNQVGVGVAWDGNTMYVSEVFARRTTTTSSPEPAVRRAPVIRRVAAAPRPQRVVMTRLVGRIWHVDVVAEPMTVAVLEKLIALDQP